MKLVIQLISLIVPVLESSDDDDELLSCEFAALSCLLAAPAVIE